MASSSSSITTSTSSSSLKWAQVVFTPLPSVAAFWYLRATSSAYFLENPLTALTVFLSLNFTLGLWVHSLVAKSTWLVDPYWTLTPLLVHAFFALHPHSRSSARSVVAGLLLHVWSARLSFNYWRREKWTPGAREDWRFADMRKKHRFWALKSLPIAYIPQQFMLLGLCLPLRSIYQSNNPLNVTDFLAIACCLTGLATARRADDELAAYMASSRRPVVLKTGLWCLCRHPNHLGEQAFWVGFALFAASYERDALGFALNHLLDTFGTLPLITERMLSRQDRRKAYLKYMAETPLIYPTPASAKRFFSTDDAAAASPPPQHRKKGATD